MNTCGKCGHKAASIGGTRHRRCPAKAPVSVMVDGVELSEPSQPLRPKHSKLAVAERGIWS